MSNILKIKVNEHDFFFLLLALVFGTVLRVTFLIFYPVFVLLLYYYFNWRLAKNGLYVFLIIFFCWLLSMRNGLFLKYNIVNFYFYLTFLLLLFAVPHPTEKHKDFFKKFIRALTIVAIVNNVFGIIQYILNPSDDSFVGLYGQFTVSQNGLSLVNSLLFFYYLQVFLKTKRIISISLSGFFFLCSVMAFYGAGIIALLLAIGLFYFKVSLKSVVKFVFIMGLSGIVAYYIMKEISPRTLQYNVEIIKKFYRGLTSTGSAPRKVVIFHNYLTAYSSNPLDLLLGSGPGTFNSRSAFIVGSPTYFRLPLLKSDEHPYYFYNYAYVLWNPKVITVYDGFMNQPFTSSLALLGEYGLIVVLLIIISMGSYYRRFFRQAKNYVTDTDSFVALGFSKFLLTFLVVLILIDNYIEYPETISLILVLLKLSESELRLRMNNM